MIVDHLSNWRLYSGLPILRRAFELLDSPTALKWPEGRFLLDGERIFAMPQGYATKPLTEGKWEAHRKYIDIQYMVTGGEKMGWAPLATMQETTPYDATKDVAFFTGTGDVLTVGQGMFAVFFPHDVHMPTLQLSGQPQQVRKIVMKVAVEGGI